MHSTPVIKRSLSMGVGIAAFVACFTVWAPAAPGAPGSAADQVIGLTNAQRAKAGCPALRADTRLTRAAQAHSSDMAARGVLSHNSAAGDPGARIRAVGYSARGWAENIASGQRGPSEVVDAWMRSPGHRANILNCGLRDIGVGLAQGRNGTPYWTQDFGVSSPTRAS